MKAAVNRELINRICVNSAKISGARMSDAGMSEASLLHPSLVDYWNFGGKSNSDEDRDTIKGIKGGILTAYNFGWSLGSGYGLYGTDFGTQWNDTDASYGKIINSTIAHTDKVGSGLYVIAYSTLIVFADNFKGRITGMPEGYSLYIGYATNLYLVSPTNGEWSINKADIPYLVPEGSPESNAKYNGGFKIMKTGQLGGGAEVPADVTIELMPDYPGAIVTDGVDDYLKFNKVGYKIGTIIIKYIPISFNMGLNTVFMVFGNTSSGILRYAYVNNPDQKITAINNFDNYSSSNNCAILSNNTPTEITSELHIGNNSIGSETINMALYSIAIYQRKLTDEEGYEEITKIQSL